MDEPNPDPTAAATGPDGDRRLRAADVDRDELRAVVREAQRVGRLDAAEAAEREAAIDRARYVDELPANIWDLPEGRDLVARLQQRTDPVDEAGAEASPTFPLLPQPGAQPDPYRTPGPSSLEPTPALGPGQALEPRQTHQVERATAGRVRTSGAVMSGKTINLEAGESGVRSYLLMGGDDLYLRDALGPGREVVVEIYAMWAGSDIFVPPGVRVVDETVNIMGGNGVKPEAMGDGSNGTVILKGLNLMAGNDVKLDPGVPSGSAGELR